MIISYNDFLKTAPKQMKGIILLQGNDQPLEKVHVAIANGNEVTQTDAGGGFCLNTCKGLPVELIIEHLGYETVTFRWERCSDFIQIRLIKK